MFTFTSFFFHLKMKEYKNTALPEPDQSRDYNLRLKKSGPFNFSPLGEEDQEKGMYLCFS